MQTNSNRPPSKRATASNSSKSLLGRRTSRPILVASSQWRISSANRRRSFKPASRRILFRQTLPTNRVNSASNPPGQISTNSLRILLATTTSRVPSSYRTTCPSSGSNSRTRASNKCSSTRTKTRINSRISKRFSWIKRGKVCRSSPVVPANSSCRRWRWVVSLQTWAPHSSLRPFMHIVRTTWRNISRTLRWLQCWIPIKTQSY